MKKDNSKERVQTHYYLLPDGTRAENMKEACEALSCGTSFLKTLLKRGLVKKIIINSDANSTHNTQKDGIITTVIAE